ncbi:MAG: hypothetical protein WAK86_10030, partial [Pseudonocardiaceae bacterium]
SGPSREPLFPSAALLPLSDLGCGHVPLAGAPGRLRPLSASRPPRPRQTRHHSRANGSDDLAGLTRTPIF